MMNRRRVKQPVPFEERLAAWTEEVRKDADRHPPGSPEREALLKKAQQAETASRLEGWASSPGLQAPK